ncbi:MAG: hypothetical protein WC781_05505 [Candidatus Pacearchaeota archaeon]|jgi:hypothetical protein
MSRDNYKTYWIVELCILVATSIFTFVQIIFKQEFVSSTSQIISIGSWFFGLTVAAMIPGIFYKGGEGYNLVFGKFTHKENAFLWFLLELVVALLIAAGLVWIVNYLFELFYNYIHLIIVEWVLMVYIWFSNRSDYNFPWFYTIITNLILIANGYFIFRFY